MNDYKIYPSDILNNLVSEAQISKIYIHFIFFYLSYT